MISPQLASWQSRNQFRSDDDVVYGVHESCGFSVSEDDDGLLFIFMLSPRDDEAFDDFEDALLQEGGELAEGQVGDVEGYLAVFFDQSRGLISARTMNRLLDFVVEQARPCGFRAPNICVKCGARANKRSFVNGMVQPLCAQCSAQNKQSRRAAANAARKPAPPPAADPRTQEDNRYAEHYAPLVPDNSKYDDSYDEYADMAPNHSNYDSEYSRPRHEPQEYDPPGRQERQEPPQKGYERFDASPISFDDSGQDDRHRVITDDPDEDYFDIVGDGGEHSATVSETHIEGSGGMGALGAFLGALLGVIPYLIIAFVAKFPMAALCFPAGMLAVWFYTLLRGRKSMGCGMGMSIGFSTVMSVIAMFIGMTVYCMNESRDFGQAVSYLFSEQVAFLLFNTVFALLGSVFGALFMIVVMAKYVESNS